MHFNSELVKSGSASLEHGPCLPSTTQFSPSNCSPFSWLADLPGSTGACLDKPGPRPPAAFDQGSAGTRKRALTNCSTKAASNIT